MNRLPAAFPGARILLAGLAIAGLVLGGPAISGAPSALAAEVTGAIVEQASGRAIAGLEVRLVRRSTQKEAGVATSDAQGRFRFANVVPGPYLVTLGLAPPGRTIFHMQCSVARVEVDLRPGPKFMDSELLGIPLRITLGERNLKDGNVELYYRKDDRKDVVPLDDVVGLVERFYSEYTR